MCKLRHMKITAHMFIVQRNYLFCGCDQENTMLKKAWGWMWHSHHLHQGVLAIDRELEELCEAALEHV